RSAAESLTSTNAAAPSVICEGVPCCNCSLLVECRAQTGERFCGGTGPDTVVVSYDKVSAARDQRVRFDLFGKKRRVGISALMGGSRPGILAGPVQAAAGVAVFS